MDKISLSSQFIKKIEFLENKKRQEFPPEEILELIPLNGNDTILDLGAGSGYFTLPAAKLTAGEVTALDMDARMLKIIEEKAVQEKLDNIRLAEGDILQIPMEDKSVDLAVASLILHEVKDLEGILKEMSRVVKDGGYFLCLEYEKIESPDGPPMEIRIPSSTMKSELECIGFTEYEKVLVSKYIYVLIARKTGCNY